MAADSPTHRAMGAQLSMYSRHQDAPASAPVAKETGRGESVFLLVNVIQKKNTLSRMVLNKIGH